MGCNIDKVFIVVILFQCVVGNYGRKWQFFIECFGECKEIGYYFILFKVKVIVQLANFGLSFIKNEQQAMGIIMCFQGFQIFWSQFDDVCCIQYWFYNYCCISINGLLVDEVYIYIEIGVVVLFGVVFYWVLVIVWCRNGIIFRYDWIVRLVCEGIGMGLCICCYVMLGICEFNYFKVVCCQFCYMNGYFIGFVFGGEEYSLGKFRWQ